MNVFNHLTAGWVRGAVTHPLRKAVTMCLAALVAAGLVALLAQQLFALKAAREARSKSAVTPMSVLGAAAHAKAVPKDQTMRVVCLAPVVKKGHALKGG